MTTRDDAILQGLDLVKRIARRFCRRVPPCVEFDDLASVGMIGLIQAVDRFDSTRDLKFSTYAQHRIWGAMQDFLRGEDPLSRTERRKTGYNPLPMTISLDQIPERYLAQPAFTSDSEVREARRCLSLVEDRVIGLFYDFGWICSEVAAELRINERRVYQIKQGAISKLRHQLAEPFRLRA